MHRRATILIFPLMLLPCLVHESVAQQPAGTDVTVPSSFQREQASATPVSFTPSGAMQKISQEQIARTQEVLEQAKGKTTDHVLLKNILLKQAVNPAMPAAGEQLVYVAEIENISPEQIQCNFIILKAFDPAGGLVDLFYLGGGSFASRETKIKSGLFPIRPDSVGRLRSLSVESRCSLKAAR